MIILGQWHEKYPSLGVLINKIFDVNYGMIWYEMYIERMGCVSC